MKNIDYSKYEPIFGAWHIVDKIGEGTFGTVYIIERQELGISYRSAMKAITIPGSHDEVKSVMAEGMTEAEATTYYQNIVKDIVREFVLMSKLKGNSNIVSYEDHVIIEHEDEIGWDILIRMEFLTPLVDHAIENPLTPDDVIKLGIDMCRALEVCRRNNIIHRDIKPENILISDNGDYKLGDFGIARTVEKTMIGLSRKGTYVYMAPEVFYGSAYGPTVDIYSVGIVMYKFLNGGRTPFMPDENLPIIPEDREASVSKRFGGAMIEPPKYGSPELGRIVLKACSFREEDRYQRAEDMRAELEALQRGEILKEKKTEQKEQKKKKWIIPVIIAAVITIGLGLYLAIPKEVTDITGIDEDLTIYTGDTFETEYGIKPDRFKDEKITFKADDEDVIEVSDEGNIKGLKQGETGLTLTAKGYSETIDVKVENKVKKISCDSSIRVEKGESEKLDITLSPEKFKDEKITYHISDKDVARVSDGRVEGLEKGSAILTIRAGGCEKKVEVTVFEEEKIAPVQTYTPSYSAPSSSSKKSDSKKSSSKKKSSDGFFDSSDDETF